MSTASFRGYFINLDKNQDRLASMTQQLADVGLAERYQRFPAINGSDLGAEFDTKLDRGNLGLWLTHERLIEANRSSDAHLHILEDDALLPKDAARCFAEALDDVERDFPNWDILYSEVFLHMNVPLFQFIWENKERFRQTGMVKVSSLMPALFAGTSSIFINRRSLDKYLSLIRGRWTHGSPIDLFLRSLIKGGLLKAYVTVPFMTSLCENTQKSDIRGELNLSHRVMNLYRRAAFKDADLARLPMNRTAAEFTEIYLEVLRFFLGDQHVNF